MKRYPVLVVPLFYFLLTLLLTYPLMLHLQTYVADTGDPLLNTWALAWGRHALLQPWSAIADLFNANAFYPYTYSLGFSEHLLLYAALTLPLSALQLGPIFAHNAAILFSIMLAGWGMALLVTHWTGNRWAGLVAGVIFAFIPARLNHWAHLHQLSIQWLPFLILSLDRWLARRQWRDAALFGLFLNGQLLSTINYIPQTVILAGLFLLFALISFPRRFFSPHVIGGGIILLIATIFINRPIVNIYFDLRELHGFERNLGDARLYGAALVDYLTPPPENLLYGDWLTPWLAQRTRPLIPLFSGVVPAILVLIGLGGLVAGRNTSTAQKKIIWWLFFLTILAGLLSFGANELALGERLSSLTHYVLFYRWLFQYVPGFSGLRVPARLAILVFFGIAALAGMGLARLSTRFRFSQAVWGGVTALIVIEYLPLPLPGVDVPVQGNIPPVYQYLAANPTHKVVLTLPYGLKQGGANELPRLYYSAYGWYRLVNGASGFNPDGLIDLSLQMQRFPDPTTFDILRQLGVTHLVLRSAEFTSERWHDIWSKLPGYWPAVASLTRFGSDYLLALHPPRCAAQVDDLLIEPVWLDEQLALAFTNQGATTYFLDPQVAGQIQAGRLERRFFPPLFIPAGETRTTPELLSVPPDFNQAIRLDLPALSLKTELSPGYPVVGDRDEANLPPEVSLNLDFGNNLHLLGYTLNAREGTNCRTASLRLYWTAGNDLPPNMRASVRLVDRFGQTVAVDTSQPAEWAALNLSGREIWIDEHRLPILEPTPAGQFGLVLGVLNEGGVPLPPSNAADLLVIGPELLLSNVLVRPLPPADRPSSEPLGTFENGISLLGYQIDKNELSPGDFLHLTLYWQTNDLLTGDLTVFTQLLDVGGQVRGQQDNPPRAGWYPTSVWQPGEIVADDYLLPVDPATPPGTLSLQVGFYHPATLERLSVAGGDSLSITQVAVKEQDGQLP